MIHEACFAKSEAEDQRPLLVRLLWSVRPEIKLGNKFHIAIKGKVDF